MNSPRIRRGSKSGVSGVRESKSCLYKNWEIFCDTFRRSAIFWRSISLTWVTRPPSPRIQPTPREFAEVGITQTNSVPYTTIKCKKTDRLVHLNHLVAIASQNRGTVELSIIEYGTERRKGSAVISDEFDIVWRLGSQTDLNRSRDLTCCKYVTEDGGAL